MEYEELGHSNKSLAVHVVEVLQEPLNLELSALLRVENTLVPVTQDCGNKHLAAFEEDVEIPHDLINFLVQQVLVDANLWKKELIWA